VYQRPIGAVVQYPFLQNNQLILIDYLPGSSGQLLMRLLAEADATLSYDNPNIFTPTSITDDPVTYEIDYDILIPKKLTNWFMNRCEPATIEDWLSYFEIIGTTLVALRQRWKHGNTAVKFYENEEYRLQGQRVLLGIHTWRRSLPIAQLQAAGFNINRISIVAATTAGKQYQIKRCQACYPMDNGEWQAYTEQFNSKHCEDPFDLCSLLVAHDDDAIISWLKNRLLSDFRVEKETRLRSILQAYQHEIVDKLHGI